MSEDLKELQKELESLKKQRIIKTKELERARVRTTGRLTDPSNRGFAAGIAEELKKVEKHIAEKEAEIEKAEGYGQKS